MVECIEISWFFSTALACNGFYFCKFHFWHFKPNLKSWEIETKLQKKSTCFCSEPRVCNWVLLDFKQPVIRPNLSSSHTFSLTKSRWMLFTKRNENRAWSQVRFEVILGRKLRCQQSRRSDSTVTSSKFYDFPIIPRFGWVRQVLCTY